jgi:glutaredoxin
VDGENSFLKEFVKRLPRVKAIPQIFINGEHIGSFEDLTILADDGRLEKILSS